MNDFPSQATSDLLTYQAHRFRELILEMVECCEDRKMFESEKFGLPYSEMRCLMLFNGERYLTVKGIARRLDVAKSRVTKITNGLIEKGLVDQIKDPEDSRIRLIRLTQKGRRKSDEIFAYEREIHRKVLLQIRPDERKNALSYLEIFRSAMEAVKEEMGT